MLSNQFKRSSARPVVKLSCLTLIVLAGCAKADDPELFRADPNLLNDFTMSLPSNGTTGGYQYEIIQGLAIFEGDILLGAVNSQGIVQSKVQSRGLGRSDAFGRWPDGIVAYMAPDNNSSVQQNNIEKAIAHWTEKTSITFIERTAENQAQYPSYIRFDSSYSCASYVGMQGGAQSILVSDACSMGSIVHEIGHALGLFHEHTRPDRDNFAQIDWDQIVGGKEINFNILSAGAQNVGAYDYGSIMHYGEYFFSATGKRTIVVPDGITVGQRKKLSDSDAESINLMYATDLALQPATTTSTAAGLEIDISVSNQGSLGAHQLQLIVKIGNDAVWQGISQNSGWECVTSAAELHCTRPTLTEQTESRFTVLVDPNSGNSNTLSMKLSSRTTDTDTSNNTYNDTSSPFVEKEDHVIVVVQDKTTSEPVEEENSSPIQVMPTMGAAQSGSGSSNDAPGGGSDNGALFALALVALGWKRRKRTIRKHR